MIEETIHDPFTQKTVLKIQVFTPGEEIRENILSSLQIKKTQQFTPNYNIVHLSLSKNTPGSQVLEFITSNWFINDLTHYISKNHPILLMGKGTKWLYMGILSVLAYNNSQLPPIAIATKKFYMNGIIINEPYHGNLLLKENGRIVQPIWIDKTLSAKVFRFGSIYVLNIVRQQKQRKRVDKRFSIIRPSALIHLHSVLNKFDNLFNENSILVFKNVLTTGIGGFLAMRYARRVRAIGLYRDNRDRVTIVFSSNPFEQVFIPGYSMTIERAKNYLENTMSHPKRGNVIVLTG